jgi:hypothetical protein
MASRRGWVRLLRRLLVITVASVGVLGLIGLVLGGPDGAAKGAVLGLVCGAMGLPGLLLGLALNAGDEYADQTSRAFDRRSGSGSED